MWMDAAYGPRPANAWKIRFAGYVHAMHILVGLHRLGRLRIWIGQL